ncbi:MAG: LysM peptidoglycan-binding domain-containing protein [Desulfobacterales bacterium]|nr:MAG: LysM peptidoglycan-binding domain-containing protein [Desulfobacterales bacterium]
MAKLNALLLLIIWFILSGCTHALYKAPTAEDNDIPLARKHAPEVAEGNKAASLDPEKPFRQDVNKALHGTTPADPATASDQITNIKTPESENDKISDENKTTPYPEKKLQSTLDEALDFCQLSQVFWQKGEFESALEALDQAYSLILAINSNESPEIIQQKEDLRFMISKRILEIHASRNIVVNGDHNAIPLLTNKHIQAELNRFLNSEKKFFVESYKRSGRYREYIVNALREAGLPIELSWLPLIESGFKVNALSKARALGLWQFISSTGYKFGLKRDKYIDERLDPIKSTKAAIAYLKELHQIFGDWTTALAAYNCGEGLVLRVIRTQNINYLDNFWDLYDRLPLETARYVPRFMATLHMVKNLQAYGLDSIIIENPMEFEIVNISKQVHLRHVAKQIGVDEKTLKKLNPELRYRILPQDKYPLRVPPGKSELLLARLDKIPVSYPPRRAFVYHRVKPGESLSTIARRYRTSVSKIARANNIRKRHYIVAGKRLKIPRKGYQVYRPKKVSKSAYKHASTHAVKSGDSLWIIAKRYGTTTKKIQEQNNLTTTNLSIGQILKIPGRRDEKPLSDDVTTYLVKRGDSPFQIAQKYKMPLERFLRINNLTPSSNIYPGQQLYVE